VPKDHDHHQSTDEQARKPLKVTPTTKVSVAFPFGIIGRDPEELREALDELRDLVERLEAAVDRLEQAGREP
jgi:hypothetical protein